MSDGSITVTAVFTIPSGMTLPNPAYDPTGVHTGIPPGQANIVLDFTHKTLPPAHAPLDGSSQKAISHRIELGSILLAVYAFADQEFREVVRQLTPLTHASSQGGRRESEERTCD